MRIFVKIRNSNEAENLYLKALSIGFKMFSSEGQKQNVISYISQGLRASCDVEDGELKRFYEWGIGERDTKEFSDTFNDFRFIS